MSYAMFDFYIEDHGHAGMEIDPGSFYVGFSFGLDAMFYLAYIDGEWVTERNKWLPEPKQEGHHEQVQ